MKNATKYNVISLLAIFLLHLSTTQAQSCCCAEFWGIFQPPDVTMECLFQHDYFSTQWNEEYTGYAARLDACAFDDDDAPLNYCLNCNCDDDGNSNDGGGAFHEDRYEIAGSTNIYDFGCGNTVTITRTFSLDCTDPGGFPRTATQTITVEDNIRPELFIPAPNVQECVSTDGIPGPDFDVNNLDPYFGSARATDLCTNPIFSIYDAAAISTNACRYQLLRRFQADDGCNYTPPGNGNFVSQQVEFRDTTPPHFTTFEALVELQCDVADDYDVVPGYTDACDNINDPPNAPAPIDQIFPGKCTGDYTIERIWSVGDTCGNIAYTTQIIVVEDLQPPVVTLGGNLAGFNTLTEASCVVPPPNDYVVSDLCGTAYLTYEESTSGFIENANHYDVIRYYKAADDCGNYIQWEDVIQVDLANDIIFDTPSSLLNSPKNTDIIIPFTLTGTICQKIFLAFDIGAATLVSVQVLTGCTLNTGGLLYCPIAASPVAVNIAFSITINVPSYYIPNSLQIRYSVGPVDQTVDQIHLTHNYIVIRLS